MSCHHITITAADHHTALAARTELQKHLVESGIKGYKFAGHGPEGVCLAAIASTKKSLEQACEAFSYEGVQIDVSPAADPFADVEAEEAAAAKINTEIEKAKAAEAVAEKEAELAEAQDALAEMLEEELADESVEGEE